MLDIIPSFSYILTDYYHHFNPTYEVGNIIIPILQMIKLRQRMFKKIL